MFQYWDLAWYAEFILEINLKILLRKTGARLNFKIALISLHIDPGPTSNISSCEKSSIFFGKKIYQVQHVNNKSE
jgi:hypothetical protein